MFKFEDDTVILVENAKCLKTLLGGVKSVLIKYNFLVNKNKSKVMKFRKNEDTKKLKIKLEEHQLDKVKEFTHLRSKISKN